MARQLSGVHRSDMALTPEQNPLLMAGSGVPAYTQAKGRPPVGFPLLRTSPCGKTRIRICCGARKPKEEIAVAEPGLDDVFADDITVPAADGYPLAPTLFLLRAAKRQALLIKSPTTPTPQ